MLNSLLHRYIEGNPANASKRFGRVVALLENHSMQEVFDAIEVSTYPRKATRPIWETITLILKHARRPYDADDDSLRVFDSERFRVDRHNWYREQVKPAADSQLIDKTFTNRSSIDDDTLWMALKKSANPAASLSPATFVAAAVSERGPAWLTVG